MHREAYTWKNKIVSFRTMYAMESEVCWSVDLLSVLWNRSQYVQTFLNQHMMNNFPSENCANIHKQNMFHPKIQLQKFSYHYNLH